MANKYHKNILEMCKTLGQHQDVNPGGGGGGTWSENWWGCAAGRWKLDPKRSREKWNLGPKRSNSVRIGSFNTPKDRFGVGGWEKIPQKDRVQSSECQKRGSKRRHIHITQHRGSTLPGDVNFQSHTQNQLWISTWCIFHEFHKVMPG